MSDQAQDGGQQTPPTQEDFAGKMQSSMGSLSFLAYLFHPDQPSFDDYEGPVPEGFREKIGSLAEMGSFLGLGGDMMAPQLDQIADSMTPERVLSIFDGLDGKQFQKIYDNKDLKPVINNVIAPVIMAELEKMTLGEAIKEANLGVNVDMFQKSNGEKLSDQLFMKIDETAIATFSSELTDTQTLAFLNGLPKAQQDAFLVTLGSEHTQDADGNMVPVLDGDGNPVPLQDSDGNAIKLSGLSIEQAIEERAKFGMKNVRLKDTFAQGIGAVTDKLLDSVNPDISVIGGFMGLDASKSSVYDTIRAGIPASFMDTIEAEKIKLNDLSSIPADQIFSRLKSKLADPESRKNILDVITTNMDSIRENLKNVEDIAFLAQFLPEDVQNKQMGQGIRDALNQMGLLQPVIQMVGMFLSWFQGLDLGRFNGIKETLSSAIDVEKLQQDGLTRDVNNAANGQTPDPAGDDPVIDPNAPVPSAVTPGGK